MTEPAARPAPVVRGDSKIENCLMKTLYFTYFSDSSVLCQVCNTLATGLMQPWYPSSSSKTFISVFPGKKTDGKKEEGKKDKNPAAKVAAKMTASGFDPDAIAELKQALEV